VPDRYANFAALCAAEVRGEDFRIYTAAAEAAVAIIAPHGGKIERGTSEIAKAAAGDTYRVYSFEGTKAANNRHLHITSTNFDEPEGVKLVAECDQVVAIHGCEGGERTIFLGGRDTALKDAVRAELERAGIATGVHPNADLQGLSRRNICNRGRSGRGVQLEISPDLRDIVRADTDAGRATLASLAGCIRRAIAKQPLSLPAACEPR
jgi:phage replication-related protein YjqB (UPF0714/DUF867 family)